MSTNFQKWLDDADMPTNQNGVWVDLETGIAYDSGFDYARQTTRTKISDAAKSARDIAKSFGAKALGGTKKQKEWAEKIRAEKLATMTHDQAELVCDKNGLLNHSKFWIENRTTSSQEISSFIINQKGLLAQAKKLQGQDAEKYAEIAAQYNALTAKWGF